MAKPRPPRKSAAPKLATPSPPAANTGEAMPLSHATAFALRDVAAHHNMTATAAAEYAIGLWHWITAQEKQGHVLCMADADGEVYRVELPPPKVDA